MMNKIQGGVTITAIMDGVTLNGNIMVLNTPLIQRYPAEGGKPIPDFEALSEAKKPVAVPYIVEAMSGKVLVPNQNHIQIQRDCVGVWSRQLMYHSEL